MKVFFLKVKHLISCFLRAGKDTQMRTIGLFVAIINMILTTHGSGKVTFTTEDAWQWITTLLIVSTSLAAWWKNNSYSSAALAADEVKECLMCGEGEEDNCICEENDNAPDKHETREGEE